MNPSLRAQLDKQAAESQLNEEPAAHVPGDHTATSRRGEDRVQSNKDCHKRGDRSRDRSDRTPGFPGETSETGDETFLSVLLLLRPPRPRRLAGDLAALF